MSKKHLLFALNAYLVEIPLNPYSREILIFSTIYREGQIVKASEMLDLDQGNLSRALKKLEDQFGEPLFYRHRGGVKPTDKGHALYKALGEMNQSWSSLVSGQSQLQSLTPLRVGMHPSLACNYMGPILEFLEKQNSFYKIEVVLEGSTHIAERVRKREIDLAIVANVSLGVDVVVKALPQKPLTWFQ
jgi:DNA-binding transcriptional LysR family regulator